MQTAHNGLGAHSQHVALKKLRLKNRRRPAIAKNCALVLFGAVLVLTYDIYTTTDAERLARATATLASMEVLQQEVTRCFPVDIGEVSILSLVKADGVLKLECEKSAAETAEMQDSSLSFAVPITVY
ncbi:MAG TPA: hypothetical protein VK974_00810 [Methylophilaceae bacterium]|nr:hypothetical protein [Methylophilaceae bacterium]